MSIKYFNFIGTKAGLKLKETPLPIFSQNEMNFVMKYSENNLPGQWNSVKIV